MEPVVDVLEGRIRGIIKNNAYYAFLCIPYGKAPLGNLRFMAPLPVEPWEGIKDVTHENNICFQRSTLTGELVGGEDCLTLHVFTKKLPGENTALKPVMVFIHGGGFMRGSPETNAYGPEYLIAEDVVLVSISYRVGLLGFLKLNDLSLDIPGNAGLKDQVLALKWVQRNIKMFNGDPNNVTIFGQSAGAVSVELLVLSPTAKNLFHKAIIQSGSILNQWARGKLESSDLANYLGKPHLTEKELLKELREMTVEQLFDVQTKFMMSKNIPGDFGIIGPVVEKPNPTAFLTQEPMDIIRSGNYNSVPIITGYTNNEGAIFALFEKLNKMNNRSVAPIIVEKLLPYETDLTDNVLVQKISDKLKHLYTDKENKMNSISFVTDACFITGIIISAENQAKFSKNPVYLYRFSLDTKLNRIKNRGELYDHPGACHGDDLGYLFTSIAPAECGDDEKMIQKKVISLWTNFAKYDNPTPKFSELNIQWKPIENGELYFLQINNDLQMDVNPEADRMEVWRDIYRINPRTNNYC